jgi:uncharacterized membrane protein YpjA
MSSVKHDFADRQYAAGPIGECISDVVRRTTVLGLVSWLVPFCFSFLFVNRSGQFLIPQPLFKSLMVVVFGTLGVALLAVAFRRVAQTAACGLALGSYWLLINLVLDLAILVPLTRMSVAGYFFDIGLRYLLIPAIATGMGAVAERSVKTHSNAG